MAAREQLEHERAASAPSTHAEELPPNIEPRGSTNSGGQPAAAASPAKASMYAGPGGDRKPGKAWGWPAYALQQACAGVLGIVIVDLVFDFQEPEVARAYYAVMRAPRVVF